MSATNVDQVLRYKGFDVEIKGVDGAPTQVDSSWISVTGGQVCIENVEATSSTSKQREYSPGKAYVSELTLSGYMTKSRKALLAWMQNSAKGTGDLRADVSITPVKVTGDKAPAHNYYDCLICRIKIPPANSGSSDPIKEVVVLRPTRYNDPA